MSIIIFTLFVFFSSSILTIAQNDLEKAWELLNNEAYTEAVELLEKFILKEPENAEANYFLGQAYFKLHCPDGSRIDSTDINLALKASTYFCRTIKISPNYKGRVFILDPYSKLTALWGTMAIGYYCMGKSDSSLWAFKFGQEKGGFNPAILEYNRNILATCEKNAILFTNGDSDTFPMWFVQMVEGYREDVTVINTSLLNAHWYVKQIKKNYPFGFNNVTFNLSDAEIDSLKPIHWKDTEFELPNKDTSIRAGRLIWTLKPTIEDIGIRNQDQVMLEILKENIQDRPIYFSSTVAAINWIGLNDYLRCDGLAYYLNYNKDEIFPELLSNNIFNVYSYEELYASAQYSRDIIWLVQNYRNGFTRLSSYWYKNYDKNRAKYILDEMFRLFPEELYPYVNLDFKNSLLEFYDSLSE